MRSLIFTRKLFFSTLVLILPTLIVLAALGAFGPLDQAQGDDSAPAPAASRDQAVDRGPVVLELFTSQGCSSCPPADRLLSQLGADPERRGKVLPLSFHVDYWNYIGWRDPFSSQEWSERQEGYARALPGGRLYTPQVVIDGRTDCVGSRRSCVTEALEDALAREPAARVRVEAEEIGEGAFRIRASTRLAEELDGERLALMVAVFENGLATEVGRGENRGNTLRNDYVVRRLERMASLSGGESSPSESEVTVRLEKGWNPERIGIAVFVQNPETQAIYGAAAAAFGGTHVPLPSARSSR